MISAARPRFRRWLREKIAELAISQNALARNIGYHSSQISKVLAGARAAKPEFQVRVLVGLYAEGVFAHVGELLQGWAWEGVTPAVAVDLLERFAPSPLGREIRDEVIAWQEAGVDPRMQGVQLPGHYVARPAVLRRLKRRLLASPLEQPLVLWGSGGSGKSVLARALALDVTVQAHFWNGVLWGQLGPQGEPRAILRQWSRLLQIASPPHASLSALHHRVRAALQGPGRRYLLVLDDVWAPEALEPLLVAGEESATLVTLRERSLAQRVHCDEHVVPIGPLAPQPAHLLVKKRLGTQPGTPRQIRKLAQLVEYLPLALVLGAAVVKERGWAEVLAYLQHRRRALEVLELAGAERRTESVREALAVSYRHCSPAAQALLTMLGGLAPGQPFHVAYLAAGSREAPDFQVISPRHQRVLRELVQASLLEELAPGRWYRLPRVVAFFALAQLQADARTAEIMREYVSHVQARLEDWGSQYGTAATLALQRHWPHIAQAWHAAPDVWRWCRGAARLQAVEWAETFGYFGGAYLQRQQQWQALVEWFAVLETLLDQLRAEGALPPLTSQRWLTLWSWGLEAAVRIGDADRLTVFLLELDNLAGSGAQGAVLALRAEIWRGWWALLQEQAGVAERCYEQVRQEAERLALQRQQPEWAGLVWAEACTFLGAYAEAQDQWGLTAWWVQQAVRCYAALWALPDRGAIYVGRLEQVRAWQRRVQLALRGWPVLSRN